MKIIIALILVISFILILCSCGNMSMGIGTYNFEHIHFSDGAINAYCATVEKWYDVETGIEVKTKEYGSIFLSEGNYVLIQDGSKCPFCN